LFPMPERPQYERLNDEEQGIRLDDMAPKHAYIDGDNVVSEADAQKEIEAERERETAPIVPAVPAVPPSPLRVPRTPTAPYPVHDDDYITPPPALLPGAGLPSGRSSPIRRDFQPSPVRNPYSDDHYTQNGGGYFDNSYDTSHHSGGGGYRDDGYHNDGHHNDGYRDDGYNNNYEQYYYENTRGGGHGSSRRGELNL
jgi:hypothetical protein